MHDYPWSTSVQTIDVPGAMFEHGALVDVALVGDLTSVDGRRMFEDE